MPSDDTIAAISSAVGPAARMIVRASGPLVRQIHQQLIGSSDFNATSAVRTSLRLDALRVPAWVYRFAAPHSATGEDVIELHIPGNPLLARMLLDELIRIGARQAGPGEFTARAYFNGRIDLGQAEGVAATIAAHSERELAAARQLLAGELARRLRPMLDEVAETLALVEVGIDFSEEDVSFLSSDQIRQRIMRVDQQLGELLRQTTRFDRISHEPRIVLVGRPNAGKSTLLNALAGRERAVVSPVAGTTRDVIWEAVKLRRGIVQLIDVAGLEQPNPNAGSIEIQMQQFARRAVDEADLVLLVIDSTMEDSRLELPRPADLIVHSRIDLAESPRAERFASEDVAVSAVTGAGIELLRQRLDRLAFGEHAGAAKLALNARHVQAIESARRSLALALERSADAGAEVLAMELRESLDALGSILGMVCPDELLGRVFANFCIGK